MMDPDANLQEMREIWCEIQALNDLAARVVEGDPEDLDDVEQDLFDEYDRDPARINDAISDKGTRLAELVQALDGWITNGGFLPQRWRRASSNET